jgi:hypothetical protein
MVRFGTPELTWRGMKLPGGVGAGVVCIESLDVLENEDGPPEFRLFLLLHLKKEVQDRGPLPVPPSGPKGDGTDCSVLDSDSWGDLDRDNFLRNELFDAGLISVGACGGLASEGASGGCRVLLSMRRNAAKGPSWSS